MKRRYLRKEIEVALSFITMLEFMFVAMVDDMDVSFLPIYLGIAAVVCFNIYILKKYGKGVLSDD